ICYWAKEKLNDGDGEKSRTGHHRGVKSNDPWFLADADSGKQALGSSDEDSGKSAVNQQREKNECVRDGDVSVRARNFHRETRADNHRHDHQQYEPQVEL